MPTELDTHHADLVKQLTELHAHITELTEQTEHIKDKLRDSLDTGTHTINGQPAITLTPTRRFNPTLATTTLPPELLTLCQVTTVDTKRAKQILPPSLYEACQETTGKTQVRLA